MLIILRKSEADFFFKCVSYERVGSCSLVRLFFFDCLNICFAVRSFAFGVLSDHLAGHPGGRGGSGVVCSACGSRLRRSSEKEKKRRGQKKKKQSKLAPKAKAALTTEERVAEILARYV